MPSLKVLTYNIHSGRSRRLTPTLESVAEVIRGSEPDIVGLQEVDVGCPRSNARDQPSWLAEATGMSPFFFELVNWETFRSVHEKKGRYGLACLLRPGMDVVSVDRFYLPRRGPKVEQRGFFRFIVCWEGIRIEVVNTHLSTGRRERQEQVEALARELGQRSGESDALVWMGDFNMTGRSRSLGKLLECSQDCRPERPPRFTFPANFPLLRLDRVLVGGQLAMKETKVIHSELARQASDHLPLEVTLEKRNKNGGEDARG